MTLACFNPSRGIAIIQTSIMHHVPLPMLRFQSLTRDSNHSNAACCKCCNMMHLFQSLTRDSNHSNSPQCAQLARRQSFQSLTRDSNHSNGQADVWAAHIHVGFNPSRGIAIIQTELIVRLNRTSDSFNPSRGIAIIQTAAMSCWLSVKISFNPSRGIAIIQTHIWR